MSGFLSAIIYLLVIFPSVILHEYMHGQAARMLGDDTAYLSGRLTLNPLPHIDPLGTIIVPLVLSLAGSPAVIGWAKPVPVNPYYFKDRRKGMMLTSLAGPLTNLTIAALAGLLIRLNLFSAGSIFGYYLVYLCYLNILLAVFNSVPVPPLDGSKILSGLLPRELANKYNRLEEYGMALIFILIFVFGGPFFRVLDIFINFFFRIFAG